MWLFQDISDAYDLLCTVQAVKADVPEIAVPWQHFCRDRVGYDIGRALMGLERERDDVDGFWDCLLVRSHALHQCVNVFRFARHVNTINSD